MYTCILNNIIVHAGTRTIKTDWVKRHRTTITAATTEERVNVGCFFRESYPGAIERSIGSHQCLDGDNTSSSLSGDALINGSHKKASGVHYFHQGFLSLLKFVCIELG